MEARWCGFKVLCMAFICVTSIELLFFLIEIL